jgi:hypothetical protein
MMHAEAPVVGLWRGGFVSSQPVEIPESLSGEICPDFGILGTDRVLRRRLALLLLPGYSR